MLSRLKRKWLELMFLRSLAANCNPYHRWCKPAQLKVEKPASLEFIQFFTP